jgi:predicted nucleotidyltransferase component of viral defense system
VVIASEIMRIAADGASLAIKGGTSLELRYGTAHSRASKDLDAVLGSGFHEFFERLQLALRKGWEGFTGTATRPEVIDVAGLAHRPYRFKIQLSYVGRSFTTIPVEVAMAEGDALSAVDLIPGPDLRSLGISSVEPLPCLSVEHQTAQKLHACSQPDTDTHVNDRARDLVDLQLLEREIRERLVATAEACRTTFQLRAAHQWPPDLAVRAGWSRIYAGAAKNVTDVASSIEDAVTIVQRLVDDLERAGN